ncbi:MAG: Rne/Rng family ribonuclease [Myxococcales bacterium]|nr:Rne/Rng family ribonuclease [Myxococcales bacterium]
MSRQLLAVNSEGPETRVGVIEDGVLREFFVERKRDRGMVGNIYRGRVQRVLPGMQAAFVELGPKVERSAFLFVADVLGSGEERKLFEDADVGDDSRRKREARANRRIEELLKPGNEVICQVVKDPVAQKGARVTNFVSLPGRYGVFMPGVDQVGVSRRIGSDSERQRLRALVDQARPRDSGFIVRTAAERAKDQEIIDDVDYLARLWGDIVQRRQNQHGLGLIHEELDLPLRTVRDLLTEDTEAIVIDDAEQYQRVRRFTEAFLPRFVDKIRRHEGSRAIFDQYQIEPELRTALSRRVPLKSGGSLVIDQGEALTAIDVNTGSFVGSDNLEETVTRNNLEASAEVARQLRLRNIGGIIVVDFVDMSKEGNRSKVWEAFSGELQKDRSRCNLTRISELGLVEMTRKRTRESLHHVLTEPCPTCEGAGVVKSTETMAYEVLREVRRHGELADGERLEIECHPRVVEIITRDEREYLDFLEKKFQKAIALVPQKSWRYDQYRIAGKMSSELIASEKKLPSQGGSAGGQSSESADGTSGGGGNRTRSRGGRGGSRRGGSNRR